MIESILIANRGEIACRIIRTAKLLGVRTIAVYSEIDASAPHVRLADEAVLIGPNPARESYLVQAKILEAARKTHAAAIHPGYGFLSENADFAEAVIAAGVVWVGPPAAAIRAMGPKDAAKRLMSEAGVPTTPGYLGDDQSPIRLRAEAKKIGYPILIKAVSGGGGKGMRKVLADSEFDASLASCQREASSSFGEDRVLLEKYVPRPRHIEVQVFADQHGNVVHLFERDCSLQRRHQKVIEEAPAPGMSAETRAAVCDAAVRAARAVGYEGAGTIEFIADASEGLRADRIWFMEMNTRLQVEHPVTEAVTGQDLVEWQIRVASGEPLPLKQDAIQLRGHAMEARLYAENPTNGFLPSVGPLTHFKLPTNEIRVDSGVELGGQVTSYYDPMIAKLVAHGPTRERAAAKLAFACRNVEIWPVKTNAAFLARALANPDFIAGDVDTGFIEARLQNLLPPQEPEPDVIEAAAAARFVSEKAAADGNSPWTRITGFRLNADAAFAVSVQWSDQTHRVEFGAEPAPKYASFTSDGQTIVFKNGEAYSFKAPRPDNAVGSVESDGVITSPMPGRLAAVEVANGDCVTKGQVLAVVEAMKMEHALVSPFDGVVIACTAEVGDQVEDGAQVMKLARGA